MKIVLSVSGFYPPGWPIVLPRVYVEELNLESL